MDNPVIGTDDCKLADILSIMMGCSSATALQQNWRKLAIFLDVWEIVGRLEHKLATNNTDYTGIFADLLMEWKTKQGLNATLGNLVHIFTEQCKWNDVAESMRARFLQVRAKKSRARIFSRPPQVVQRFLDDRNTLTLVITSNHENLVSSWITETVDNCCLMDRREFVDLCGKKPSQGTLTILPVIKYLIGEFNTITLLSKRCNYKCILVGSSSMEETVDDCVSRGEVDFHWTDLSIIYQQEIQDEIQTHLGMSCDQSQKPLQQLDSDSLANLINKNFDVLIKNTIPDSIPYYIPRQLSPRHYLEENVLQETDVFFIYGLSRLELREKEMIPSNEVTDTSGSIIQRGNMVSRYIVVDDMSHVEKLKGKECFKDLNVHYLESENGLLLWKWTSGSIARLQRHIIVNSTNIPESSLLLDSYRELSMPVIISDTPGMGKTVLLANIARNLQKTNDSRVIYSVISDLIELIKSKHKGSPSGVLDALIGLSTNNSLTKQYLAQNCNSLQDVFLDAFDELIGEDVPLGYECLKALQKYLPKARLWITTRPNLLEALERELSTLGYNIPPLNRSDQVNFLKLFWCNKNSDSDFEKASEYSSYILDNISSSLKEKEEQIAGIPLQCMLIAEIFEREALRYLVGMDKTFEDSTTISSLTNLFTRMVSKKLQTFQQRYKQTYTEELIEKTHAYYSLSLMFPSQLEKLKKSEFQQIISPEEMLNIGILASASVCPAPKFIHRTFAEYFVAKFMADCLDNPAKLNVHEVLFYDVFSLRDCALESKSYKFGSTKCFKFPVICYFLDSHIMNSTKDLAFVTVSCDTSGKELLDQITFSDVVEACVYEKTENIYLKLFHKHLSLPNPQREISDNIICTATLMSSVANVDLLYQTKGTERLHGIKITGKNDIMSIECSLLHLATLRGVYSLIEILLYKWKFEMRVRSEYHLFYDLFQKCMENTLYSPENEINELSQIVTVLCSLFSGEIVPHMLEASHPMKAHNIHPTLAIKVTVDLILGNMHIVGLSGLEKTLHLATKSLNAGEYKGLLETVERQCGDILKTFINSTKCEGSLIAKIIANMDLTEDLVETLLKYGLSVNNANERMSLLHIAVLTGKGEKSIELIMRHFKFTWELLQSAMLEANQQNHFKALSAMIRTLDLTNKTKFLWHILSNCKIPGLSHLCKVVIEMGADVNAQFRLAEKIVTPDRKNTFRGWVMRMSDGDTALHMAAKKQHNHLVIIELLEQGACPNTQNSMNKTPLMVALQEDYVVELVRRGANTDERDLIGNTALHWAVMRPRNLAVIKALLQNGSDPNAKNSVGKTALMVTREEKYVTALVLFGANVNEVDHNSDTALHMAAEIPHQLLFIRELLRNGANPNAKNHREISALLVVRDPVNKSLCIAITISVRIVFTK